MQGSLDVSEGESSGTVATAHWSVGQLATGSQRACVLTIALPSLVLPGAKRLEWVQRSNRTGCGTALGDFTTGKAR